MRRYHWDFFGPRAEGTARHFREHLEGFLAQHALDGCRTGLASAGDGHHAVWCSAPDQHQAGLERALRPQRWDEGPSEEGAPERPCSGS